MGSGAQRRVLVAATVGLVAAAAAPASAAHAGVPGPASRPAAHRASFPIVYPEPMHRIEAPRTDLRTLRGQVVVLAFLDDTCAGCDATADLLASLSPYGVATLGVATGIDRARARALAHTRVGRGFRIIPMASDPKGALARAFGVGALPQVIVLDRRGRVALTLTSPPAPEEMSRLLTPLLAESVPKDLAPIRTQPHLSVFDRPAGRIGPLPASLRRAGSPCTWVPGSVRLVARSRDGVRLYVARGLDGGIVIADAQPKSLGGGSGLGCGVARFPKDRRHELRRMRARGIVAAFGAEPAKGDPHYELVVLDGYTQARAGGVSFPIRNNGVIIEGVPRQRFVTLSGPAGVRHVSIFG